MLNAAASAGRLAYWQDLTYPCDSFMHVDHRRPTGAAGPVAFTLPAARGLHAFWRVQ